MLFTIASIFVQAQENFFAVLESGNIFSIKIDVQSLDL